MSNLPPGVFGNEDAFGPQEELDANRVVTCPSCGFNDEVIVTRQIFNSGAQDIWECPECGMDYLDEVVEEESSFDDPDTDWSSDN